MECNGHWDYASFARGFAKIRDPSEGLVGIIGGHTSILSWFMATRVSNNWE